MAGNPRASGRFVLRAGPRLHAALRQAAGEQGVSLNEYCVRRLSAPASLAVVPEAAAVGWALDTFGPDLVGVAVYGSWVRGEATAHSDVDLLVVLDEARPLTRELYRACDGVELAWEGWPLQAQLTHLPIPGVVAGGLWAEVALEGIVLWERHVRLSRRLVAVRRDIVEGRLVRRVAHGQPYWTTNEAA